MKKKIEIKKLKITKKDLLNSFLTDEIHEILLKSHETCKHFLSIYDNLNNSTKGKPTDKNQDLLRAMLVFASSALDVILKSLVRKNLKNCIDKKDQSRESFGKFVKRSIGRSVSSRNFYVDVDFLAEIISEENGRDLLIKKYVDKSISESLQSKGKIIEISSMLGIEISKNENINVDDFQEIFKVRNEIIHQMDVSRNSDDHRKRIQRKRDDLVEHTNKIFSLIEFFIININEMYKESDLDVVNK